MSSTLPRGLAPGPAPTPPPSMCDSEPCLSALIGLTYARNLVISDCSAVNELHSKVNTLLAQWAALLAAAFAALAGAAAAASTFFGAWLAWILLIAAAVLFAAAAVAFCFLFAAENALGNSR